MLARALHCSLVMRWLLLPLLLAACTVSTDPLPQASAARCADLEGKTFASLTQGECGLGPNGPVPCTWHLTFSANDASSTHYDWQHSDYGQSGDIQCDGATVTEITSGSAEDRGTYDAATQQLVWEGVTYAP